MNTIQSESRRSDLGRRLNALAAGLLEWTRCHFAAFSVACFIGMVFLITLNTGFGGVLREDSLRYLTKAFEISRGEWTPPHERLMGWPILEAAIFTIFGIDSVFVAMVVARCTSILLMAATIFPLAYLSRRLLDESAAVITLLAFSLFTPFIRLGWIAYSEPLFVFLTLCSACALVDLESHPTRAVVAAFLASLAYYVRPQGVFLLVAVLVVVVLVTRRARIGWRWAVLVPIVFFGASSPHLYLRHAAYGSPFDYGENSKYFVDSYQQVGDRTTPVPTLGEYLATHGVGDYFDKFVMNGAFKLGVRVGRYFGPLWVFLITLGVVRFAFDSKSDAFGIPLTFAAVLLGSLIPVFEVFDSNRFFAPAAPFLLLIGSSIAVDILRRERLSGLMHAVFVLFLLMQPALAVASGTLRLHIPRWELPRVRDGWAQWASQHVSGRIAVVEGGDLIALSALAREDRQDGEALELLNERWQTFRPGNYRTLAEAYDEFKRMNVEYVFVDQGGLRRRPFLREVYDPMWSDRFVMIKSFKVTERDWWYVDDMDIFEIRYD